LRPIVNVLFKIE